MRAASWCRRPGRRFLGRHPGLCGAGDAGSPGNASIDGNRYSAGEGDGGRLAVQPQIAIHVTDPAGRASARIACTLAIGGINISLTSGPTGWILSDDQSPGAMTLFTANRLLRNSSGPVPSVTLSLVSAPMVRRATAHINVTAPAGAVNFRVTEWSYALSHVNPNGRTVSATITRPASEASSTFHQLPPHESTRVPIAVASLPKGPQDWLLLQIRKLMPVSWTWRAPFKARKAASTYWLRPPYVVRL